MIFPEIDTSRIREEHPLTAVVGQDVDLRFIRDGREARGPCPFCQDGTDRFAVFIGDMTFNCRKCDLKGDVVQYVMERDHLSFVEAAYYLQGHKDELGPKNGRLSPRPSASEPLSQELRQKWENQLELFSQQGLYHLVMGKSEAAKAAMAWLGERGVRKEQIESEGIGYNDKWRQIIPDYRLPPGLMIPRWSVDEMKITAVNVYLSKEARQTTGLTRMMVKGSVAKRFWGEHRIPSYSAAIITEGELDACLMNRFLPPSATAISCGGAQTIPDDLSILDGKQVVICLDNDEAGDMGRTKWLERLPDAAVATVPSGNDITVAWQQGINLSEWISEYFEVIHDAIPF